VWTTVEGLGERACTSLKKMNFSLYIVSLVNRERYFRKSVGQLALASLAPNSRKTRSPVTYAHAYGTITSQFR